MSLYQPRAERPQFPRPPREVDPEALAGYLRILTEALTAAFNRIIDDLREGRETRTILSAAPSASDMEEGQSLLANVGGELRLYVRNNDGTVKYVAITGT